MFDGGNFKNFSAAKQPSETNPKSEYRNKLKAVKPKFKIRNRPFRIFCFFWTFEFVSNFGFRASNMQSYLCLAPLRPFGFAQDMLCASRRCFRLQRESFFYSPG